MHEIWPILFLVLFGGLLMYSLVLFSFLLADVANIRVALHAADPKDAHANHQLTLVSNDALHHERTLESILFVVASLAIVVCTYGVVELRIPPVGLTGFGCALLVLAMFSARNRSPVIDAVSARFTKAAGFTPEVGRRRIQGPRPTPVLPG